MSSAFSSKLRVSAWAGILLIQFALFSTPKAMAWGDLGHQAVAEIAQQNLSERAKKFIFGVLGAEPLPVAAIFPDHVRSDKRFNGFAPYHFFEIPFGMTADKILPQERAQKDSDVIISGAPDQILSSKTSRNEKMLFIRYLIHVVGDVHQPLHIGNGKDMGANLCSVKWVEPHTKEMLADANFKVRTSDENLHTVWDERLIDYIKMDYAAKNATPGAPKAKRWFGYKELADGIVADFKASATQKQKEEIEVAAQARPVEWYNESSAYHAEVYDVYPKAPGTDPKAKPVLIDPETRAFCKVFKKLPGGTKKQVINGAYDPKQIPVLDEAYARKSLPIIKSQILKGGLRLAHVLNQMAEKGTVTGIFDDSEANLLNAVQIKNEHGSND